MEKLIEFFVDGGDSSCHGLNLQQDPSRDYENSNNKFEDVGARPLFGFDGSSMTLCLKGIPVAVSRWDLLEVLKDIRGFVSLSMSEPLRSNDFERYAFVTFDSEESCN